MNHENNHPRRRRRFRESLEARALDIVEHHRGTSEYDVADQIAQEVALIVDQIDGVKDLHENQRRKLLDIECYVEDRSMKILPTVISLKISLLMKYFLGCSSQDLMLDGFMQTEGTVKLFFLKNMQRKQKTVQR